MNLNPMMKALLVYSLYTWGYHGDLINFVEKDFAHGMVLDQELSLIICRVLGLLLCLFML